MQIAMTIPPWQVEATSVEHTHDLGDTVQLEEGRKHQFEPFLHLDVGILDDDTGRIAHQADRQCTSKLAAPGFRKQACRQPASDCMELEFRYRPLQTGQQPAVRAGWIINTIAVRDQAAAHPANIQERTSPSSFARGGSRQWTGSGQHTQLRLVFILIVFFGRNSRD
jgi:hypothetical protein